MSKRTWNKLIGSDFDFYYLLKLEQLKIRKMTKYFKKHSIIADAPLVIRDLIISDRLISIILEEDNIYKAHINQCIRNSRSEGLPLVNGTIYINAKNERRFFRSTPIKDNNEYREPYRGELGRNFRDKTLKMSLRRLKALHLYNMIREYRMLNWWN